MDDECLFTRPEREADGQVEVWLGRIGERDQHLVLPEKIYRGGERVRAAAEVLGDLDLVAGVPERGRQIGGQGLPAVRRNDDDFHGSISSAR